MKSCSEPSIWIDHSKPPTVGMMVSAYFNGELQTVKVTEWKGNRCYFSNSYYLVWSDIVGFRLSTY